MTGWLASVPGMITGALSGAGSWLYDAGKNVVQGLLNGIKSLGSTIGSFFLDLLPGWIVGPFKTALGIHSPSRVFYGMGQNTVQGYLNAVADGQPDVEASMRQLAAVPPIPAWATTGTAEAASSRLGRTAADADGTRVTINVHGADDPYSVAMNVARILEGV